MKKKTARIQDIIKIGDLAEISLLELITLRTLLRFNEPIVRHALYQEVSQFVFNKKSDTDEIDMLNSSEIELRLIEFLKSRSEKKIALSSFYNSLDNLEKVGFVSYTKKGSRKKNIEKTDITKPATELVLQYYIRHGLIEDDEYIFDIAKKVLKRLNRNDYGVLLIIWLHDYIELPLMKHLMEGANETFLLAKQYILTEFMKQHLPKVQPSELYNHNQIREGNDIFDIVFLPNYEREPDFYGMKREDLLNEAIRVCKPEGSVVIAVRDELPDTDNYYTTQMISIYRESIANRIFTKAELHTDMENAKFSKIEILDFKGLLVGIGKK